VLEQRGIPGFEVTHFRATTDLTTHVSRRQRSADRYPPTDQVWRVGAGPAASADFVSPKNDAHPEYVADAFLIVTQGPNIEGMRSERTEGTSGVYGWTEREGMRIAATP
jgi:hypothetical protein